MAVSSRRSNSWVTMEISRETRHWLPWRPNLDLGESSAEDCEDPERVILFDDISSALFFVDASEANRYRLIDAFLKFLVGDMANITSNFLELDIVLENTHSDAATCLSDAFNMSQISQELWHRTSDVLHPSNCESVFGSCQLGGRLPNKLYDFVDNLFDQATRQFNGNLRTLLTIRYINFKVEMFRRKRKELAQNEVKRASKELRKLLKSLLKLDHNRSCLPVWESYALFEWEADNADEARKVLETAILMTGIDISKTTGGDDTNSLTCSVVHLYKEYVCLEFGFSNSSQARALSSVTSNRVREEDSQPYNVGRCLRVLMMMCEGKQTVASACNSAEVLPPATRVKARHVFQQRFDKLLDEFSGADVMSPSISRVASMLLDWTVCYAVFLFVTVGLSSAKELYETLINRVNGRHTVNNINRQHSKNNVGSKIEENISISAIPLPADRLSSSASIGAATREFHVDFFSKRCIDIFVGFIHRCLCISSTSLNTLRQPLFSGLQFFPNDCHLLDILVDVETAGCRINGIRDYFHRTLSLAASPVPFIYAILSETKRMRKLNLNCQVYGQQSPLSRMLLDYLNSFVYCRALGSDFCLCASDVQSIDVFCSFAMTMPGNFMLCRPKCFFSYFCFSSFCSPFRLVDLTPAVASSSIK